MLKILWLCFFCGHSVVNLYILLAAAAETIIVWMSVVELCWICDCVGERSVAVFELHNKGTD